MSFCALTKSGGRANVWSRGRLAIKSFRLISLQRNTEQMPWNDILTKKPGGVGGILNYNFSFCLRGAKGAGRCGWPRRLAGGHFGLFAGEVAQPGADCGRLLGGNSFKD